MHRVVREITVDTSKRVEDLSYTLGVPTVSQSAEVIAVEDRHHSAVLVVVDAFSASGTFNHSIKVHLVRQQYNDGASLGDLNLGQYLGSFYRAQHRWYAWTDRVVSSRPDEAGAPRSLSVLGPRSAAAPPVPDRRQSPRSDASASPPPASEAPSWLDEEPLDSASPRRP